MKVIVCGAGQVGFNISKQLADQGNDVTVIDRSKSLTRQISEQLDVQAFVGHAADPSMLERAGASDADLIVAVTLSDEVNMMACQVAYSLFRVPTKVARIRNQAYLDDRYRDLFSRGNMPVDVIISPEQEIAIALKRRLEVPGAFNMMPFVDDRIRVIGIHLDEDCPVLNTPLRQLTELFPNIRTTVVGVVRGQKIFVPRGADSLQAGDSIYVAVDTKMTDRAMGVFGHEETKARRIVIVGGGNVGSSLAHLLEDTVPQPTVRLIEADTNKALSIAETLPETIVINGDALDHLIQIEAGIEDADTIVSVADDDEVNILASLIAKKAGCPRAIALLNNPVYSTLVGEIGIDVVLDPRETTVSSILRHIRRGRIRNLYSLREGQAEVIEAEVIAGSDIVGKRIGDLKLQSDLRFGVIARNDEIFMPVGSTILQPGDKVVFLSIGSAVRKLEQLFSARADIF